MRLVPVAAVAAALLAVLPAGSAPRPAPAALIKKGLAQAVEDGRLTPPEAARFRGDLARARLELKSVPPLRAELLSAVIEDVSVLWQSYTRPRAITLFSTLAVNTDYLANHRVVGDHPDIAGPDGAIYRWFSGHGYVFHPLANTAKLNAYVAKRDYDGAARLAAALVARAVPYEHGLAWEYEIPFASGHPPWTSGMVQAVAAQALARASDLLGEPSLLDTARVAYAAVPQLLSPSAPVKPWIALYSFDRTPVLNAQLQAAISVGDYAAIAGDDDAAAMANRLTAAARKGLPRFDTGYWSLYSLEGDESSVGYQDYVITLLRKLAVRTGDDTWRETADRFEQYETEPPKVRLGRPPPTLYPAPEDGYLDEARVPIWISKRSTVTLLAAGRRHVQTLGHGWQTLVWKPDGEKPGTYEPIVKVVGPMGRRVVEQLPPITIAREPGPPPLEVTVTPPAVVSWTSDAEGTPWLALRVELKHGRERRVLDLGRRKLHGTGHLDLPPGRWHARLVAANSGGKTSSVSLGFLPR